MEKRASENRGEKDGSPLDPLTRPIISQQRSLFLYCLLPVHILTLSSDRGEEKKASCSFSSPFSPSFLVYFLRKGGDVLWQLFFFSKGRKKQHFIQFNVQLGLFSFLLLVGATVTNNEDKEQKKESEKGLQKGMR